MKHIFLFVLTATLFAACGDPEGNTKTETSADPTVVNNSPAVINYTVMNVFPHDTASFTEGLFVHNGVLFESTGSGGDEDFMSWAGPVDLKTGKPDRKVILDKKYFGEGITILNDKLYQLTYRSNIGFVYDAKTYKKLSEFNYPGEGWALTHDSTHLIMSDGTNKLQFLDPVTLKVVKIVGVEDNNGPVSNVNELEYIDGFIYANKYTTNDILRIDPATGRVTGKIDLEKLEGEAKRKYANSQETNGIAYDAAAKKIYVTGKCWPFLYEIRLN